MASGRIPASGQFVSGATPLGGGTVPRTRYVDKVGSDGWVQARLDASGVLQPLAKYTAVQVIESRNGRTSFNVTDGPSKGKTLSMSDSNAAVHLGSTVPKGTAASIVIT